MSGIWSLPCRCCRLQAAFAECRCTRPGCRRSRPLRRDLKALGVLHRVNFPIEERKLDMNGGVHIVIQVAQFFKDSRLRVRLGKLIADVRKLNALGKDAGRYPAHAVRVHDLVGDALLRRVGPAVALIFTDYRVNFFSLGAGQLCFFGFSWDFLFGQWPLPPVPSGIAAQGRCRCCRSDRDAPLAG